MTGLAAMTGLVAMTGLTAMTGLAAGSTRQDHARAGPASGGTNAKFKVAGRKRSVPRHPDTTISPIGPETPTVFRRLPLRNAGPAAPRTNMAPQRTHSRDRR